MHDMLNHSFIKNLTNNVASTPPSGDRITTIPKPPSGNSTFTRHSLPIISRPILRFPRYIQLDNGRVQIHNPTHKRDHHWDK